MVSLQNYLKIIDENTKIFGLGQYLREIHRKHNTQILRLFKHRVHISTYYYWLSNKAPISIEYLKLISKIDSNILNIAYDNMVAVSAGKKRCILPKYLDANLAYLLGAIHGDGSLNKNKKAITITTESREYLDNILSPIITNIFKTNPYIKPVKNEKCFRLDIGSKPIHSFLSIFCPVGKKKGLLHIPKDILSNDVLLKLYLTGLFDTDGCLTHIEKKRKQLYFCFHQADKRFTMEVYSAIKRLGLDLNKPRIFLSPGGPKKEKRVLKEWRIYIGSKKTLKIFLSTIKFIHPDKKKRAELMLKRLN